MNMSLHLNHVCLEGVILKTNMVLPGKDHQERASVKSDEIAFRTVLALSRSVYSAVRGIFFLSGGQKEEDATENLRAINEVKEVPRPWYLSYSFGKGL